MLKNGLLTLLFAFIPGAGQMYQGYMKRGLSLMLMCCVIGVLAMLFAPIALFLMLVFMYSFFDTLNLRAQIALGNAPADDYLVHLDPKDKRLARLLLDSPHPLWCLAGARPPKGRQKTGRGTGRRCRGCRLPGIPCPAGCAGDDPVG